MLVLTAVNLPDSFSPTCQLTEGGGILCDKCLPGYAGSQCERYVPTLPWGKASVTAITNFLLSYLPQLVHVDTMLLKISLPVLPLRVT